MRMIEVVSENISSVGYENGTLYVEFSRGQVYAYSNVPERIFRGLLNAPSCGEFLAEHVKGIYPY